jgi:two-component system sensor histidine kinase YesM
LTVFSSQTGAQSPLLCYTVSNMLFRPSIRSRLILVLLSIVIVVFAFSSFMFLAHERRNMKLIYATLYETLSAFARSLERELAGIERLAVDIMADSAVQDSMLRLNELPQDYQWYQVGDQLSSRLLSYSRLPDIPAVTCVDARNRVVSSRNDFPDFFTVMDPVQLQSFRFSTDPFRWIITDSSRSYFFLLRRIREVEGLSFKNLGTLALIVDKSQLIRRTTSHPFQAELGLAVLSGDTVVFAAGTATEKLMKRESLGPNPYEIRSLERKKYFLAQISSASLKFHYVYLLPYELLFSDLSRFKVLAILFTILLFVVILAVSVWMASTVSRPIIRLADTMRIVEAEGFTQTKLQAQSYSRRDEIGTLYREFAVMLDRIGSLIHESYCTQLVLKDTQFRSLQAQINPHFLYNTLESINWLAQLRGSEDIAEMVQALGNIMRASIDKKNVVIPLREELDLLRQYLAIQRIRYGDRLVVEIQAPTDCCGYAIPKLTLQPLVENSIRYGLERSSRPCHIAVRARPNGRFVQVEVDDNGPGMTPEFVAELLDGRVEPKGSGVGIKNIHERLKRLYGAEAALAIASEAGKSTTVTITLPKLTEKELARRIAKPYEEENRSSGG